VRDLPEILAARTEIWPKGRHPLAMLYLFARPKVQSPRLHRRSDFRDGWQQQQHRPADPVGQRTQGRATDLGGVLDTGVELLARRKGGT
jgi:hypothetical protein